MNRLDLVKVLRECGIDQHTSKDLFLYYQRTSPDCWSYGGWNILSILRRIRVEYLNEYCWKGTVKTFLALDCETWLQKMRQRYHRVTPHRLTPQQERAWKNSFNVLHDAFEMLGDDYKNLRLVFEYCLPKYPPKANRAISSQYVIRADCIVVSDKSVVVLEFKDRSDVRKEHGFTARRYRNRLHKYHDQSRGKRKWAVLVPTLSENVHEVILQRITACSPNKLADELRLQFGDKPKTVKAFQDWIASSYSIHEKTPQKDN